MQEQHDFYESIRDNNIELFKTLLLNKNVNVADDKNWAILSAVQKNCFEIVELLINDPRVNPADRNDDCIQIACEYGHLNIIELLLKDSRVDPTICCDLCVKYAFSNKNNVIANLLWNKIHLRTTLQEKYPEFYRYFLTTKIKEKLHKF
jgi:hypothetical protein